MNSTIYIFGNLSSGYTQYPGDISQKYFQDFYKNCKAQTQICVRRKDNLMYYAYLRKIDQQRYIGLCILLNNTMLTNIEKLFDLFENVMTQMCFKGILIQFDQKGDIISKTTQLYNNLSEIQIIESSLKDGLNSMQNDCKILPAIDFSQSDTSIQEFNIADNDQNEIFLSTYKSGYTFIYKNNNFKYDINSFSKQLAKTNEEKEILKKEVNKLKKEKRNTTLVTILCVVVFVMVLILWTKVWFPSEVTKKDMGEFVYYGPMQNGKPNGTGVAIYPKDDKDKRLYYYGNFRDGKRIDENAILFYKDGSYFKGSMNEDELNKGILFDVEKEHFIGDFNNNKPWNGDWYEHVKVQTIVNGK